MTEPRQWIIEQGSFMTRAVEHQYQLHGWKIGGGPWEVIEKKAFVELQEKLKVAEEFIIKLTGEEDGTIRYPAIEALRKIRGE